MYLPKVSPRVIKPVYGLATCETPTSNNGKVIYTPLTKNEFNYEFMSKNNNEM